MKINQKAFVIPLIIAIVAILAVGGGVYFYKNNKVECKVDIDCPQLISVGKPLFPTNRCINNKCALDRTFTEKDLENGWYYGNLDQKKLGTPSNWVHIGDGTRSASWSAPKNNSCIPNWQCGWGECKNGYQGMTAVDSNNCGLSSTGVNIMCPALARECSSQ
jgi:hypothetical protein